MNYKKKIWLGCSVLALAGHAVAMPAMVSAEVWQARQLHEVKADVVVTEDHAVSYTVKYGDTLGVISEAMTIDLRFLASLNNIENMDLIFPETVLTAQFDDNNQADSLTVAAPEAESIVVNIPVNLSPIETLEEAIAVEVAAQMPTPTAVEPVEEEVDAPVEEIVAQEVVEQEETIEAPAEAGNNQPITDAPEEEVGAPTPEVEQPVEETPVVEEPAEDLPAEEVPEEDLPAEEVPVEEMPIEEVPVEEIPEEISPEEPVYELPIIEEPIDEEPIIEEPVYEEPIIEEPVYEEPIIEEPVYEEPAAPTPDLNGLAYNAAVFRDEVVNMYGVTAYGLRAGDAGDHGSGLAVDFMVPVGSEIGDAIANYAINNMGAHNISYVIWEQQIYGGWTGGWEWMEDRGSLTANHYDHVHVSFY